MKKLLLFKAAFVLMASAAIAQQVKGIVKDQQGKAVEKATKPTSVAATGWST